MVLRLHRHLDFFVPARARGAPATPIRGQSAASAQTVASRLARVAHGSPMQYQTHRERRPFGGFEQRL